MRAHTLAVHGFCYHGYESAANISRSPTLLISENSIYYGEERQTNRQASVDNNRDTGRQTDRQPDREKKRATDNCLI